MIISSSIKLSAQVYDSQGVSLVGHWDNPNQYPGVFGNRYMGIWGWADTIKHREYGILASTSGTYFVDVTDPSNPIQCDFVKGTHDSSLWREIKSYSHYSYVVNDDANNFQIIDMQYLPDSVHVVQISDSILLRSHTLYIDVPNAKLYTSSAYTILYGYDRLIVYDLTNPTTPKILRRMSQDIPTSLFTYTHDTFARNDTIYVSGAEAGFFVFSQTDTSAFHELGQLTQYPEKGYNHSSWMTKDGKSMVMCDELPFGLGVKTIDISDLANIDVKATFHSNAGATAHNPFVIDNDYVVIAYYLDGIQIYNISDIANPIRTGFFDTYPQNGTTYYDGQNGDPLNGCWGAYPYLPSKKILALDMINGLFILDATVALGMKDKVNKHANVNVYPNPTSDFVRVKFDDTNTKYDIELLNILGQSLFKQNNAQGFANINLSNQSNGIYNIKVSSNNNTSTYKIIKN